MTWMGLNLTPGCNAELTQTGVQAGYVSTTLGRFKSGLFQKIGGWQKFSSLAMSGMPKDMHTWQDIAGSKYLSVGTTQALQAFTGGSLQTLTPQTFTSDTTPNFSTTAGSPIVTVVDSNISTMTPYCSVYFNTPVSVDGIILSGLYGITQTISPTSYTITAATNGLAGVSSAGAVPAFTTTSGSSNIQVTLANHGLSANDDIVFPIATTIGGITIQGRYIVVSVTDANNFTIAVATAASSSAGPTSINSGNVELVYYIATGPTQPPGAYGSGYYGAGVYGIGQAVIGQTGTPITATNWTLANWGEDLIACPENGGIYNWGPSSGFLTAELIPTAPTFNAGAFVSTSQQMIIAYGSSIDATIGDYQDKMTVRWCDIGDFTTWTAAINNQAGEFRIPTGSAIISGAATPYANLLWTDVDLWVMNYIGYPLVFSFVKAGSNCGIITKHAWTQLAGNVYWLGNNNFFVLQGGSVSPLPCPVWDVLFQDLDTANSSTCWVGSNTLHSEVLFGYPSLQDGLGYPTRYVKYKIDENVWDFGQLQRNCWVDQSTFGPPLACTQGGLIYQHETGNDADLSPMTSGFETGYFFIDEGREFVFIDKIIPDFKYGMYGQSQSATVQITVNAINEINDTPITYGPFTVTAASPSIDCRIRARQVSLTFQSSDSGSFWRLGHIRFRYSPDGRR